MKRIIAFLLLTAMMFALAACGGGTSVSVDDLKEGNITETPVVDEHGNVVEGNFAVSADAVAAISGGYDGSEVTVVFGHTMGQNLQKVLNEHIAEFNKLYPNITIEHSSYGGWGDIAGLVNKEIIGGQQPDIVYCYPDHVAGYNKAWATVTLNELMNSQLEVTRADGTTEILGLTEEQVADLKAGGFYEEGLVYGDNTLMYTLPMSKSTEVLYYNKTFFEKNGLEVPTTWDEMEALCKKLKELDPKCIPLGYDSEDNMFITMCEQYNYDFTSATGEEHYLFNNDDCKSFVKKFREWYQAGYITTEALYGAYTSGLFTELDTNVSHSYMCIGSSGGASYQRPENNAFEVGVAPIPQADASNPKVISQGPSLALLKSENEQETIAAWLFMKYLVTNEVFQAEFSMASGYMPVIASAKENPVYKSEFLDKADGGANLPALVVKVALEETDSYFTSPAFVGSSIARTQVGALLAACMSKSTDNVDAMIDQEFQKAYDECKYMGG